MQADTAMQDQLPAGPASQVNQKNQIYDHDHGVKPPPHSPSRCDLPSASRFELAGRGSRLAHPRRDAGGQTLAYCPATISASPAAGRAPVDGSPADTARRPVGANATGSYSCRRNKVPDSDRRGSRPDHSRDECDLYPVLPAGGASRRRGHADTHRDHCRYCHSRTAEPAPSNRCYRLSLVFRSLQLEPLSVERQLWWSWIAWCDPPRDCICPTLAAAPGSIAGQISTRSPEAAIGRRPDADGLGIFVRTPDDRVPIRFSTRIERGGQ